MGKSVDGLQVVLINPDIPNTFFVEVINIININSLYAVGYVNIVSYMISAMLSLT